MRHVHVGLGSRAYSILIGSGVLGKAAEEAARLEPSSASIVTHPRLAERWARPVAEGLSRRGIAACVITVPAGERHKSLRQAGLLHERLLAAGMDRRSLLLVVGGGVLGDLGGFVAATYMRGIRFVQAPTTLLAMVDASIGGKTAVDLPAGKNVVGAFHQPSAVLADIDTLETLPARELRSGLAEVVKYGIICDAALFDRVRAATPRLLRREREPLIEAIHRSCQIKADIVAEDETEQGRRATLNFGHTVGHALEAVTGYRRFKHGEAIAIGMVTAALVGRELGVTPPGIAVEVAGALQAARLPVEWPSGLDPVAVLHALQHDKKTVAGRLAFVLAEGIGRARLVRGVDPGAVAAAIEQHRRGCLK